MALGLVGKKCGMTRIFAEDGTALPVTVIAVLQNRITQIKNPETDGYNAIQITTGKKRASTVIKPLAGHYAKANVEQGIGLWEFRLTKSIDNMKVGDEIKVDVFKAGQKVDVAGLIKGRGFAGAVKRHGFVTQDSSHGNSLSHRTVGSVGQNQSPGRVHRGKRMPGHFGNTMTTIQNLEVVKVDLERNLLLIKGAVPGANGGNVIIQPAIKDKAKES